MKSRVAGCDLGKASASFVIATVSERGDFTVEEMENILHEGKPLEIFRKWYAEKNGAAFDALAVTGLYAEAFVSPAVILPEDSCQEAALEAVDGVVLFAESTPVKLIEAVRPEVYIKGSDYADKELAEADLVKSYGGRVFLSALEPEYSTTSTIDRIKG